MIWFLPWTYPCHCRRSLSIWFRKAPGLLARNRSNNPQRQSLTRKPFNWLYRRPICETIERKCLSVSSYNEARRESSGNHGLVAIDGDPCVERLTFQMSTRHIHTKISSKNNSWIKSLLGMMEVQQRVAVRHYNSWRGLSLFHHSLAFIWIESEETMRPQSCATIASNKAFVIVFSALSA
jgi:hypothetical protein